MGGAQSGRVSRLVFACAALAALASLAFAPSSLAAPANDDFPGDTLSGLPAAAAGENTDATMQEDEPDHAGVPGGASVWWSWTAPSSGPVIVDTCGSGFNTLLGV